MSIYLFIFLFLFLFLVFWGYSKHPISWEGNLTMECFIVIKEKLTHEKSKHLVLIIGIIINSLRWAVELKLVFAISLAEFPLTSGRKTRAPEATISGMRHRYRLRSETGWAEFGYFLVYCKVVAPRVSRFLTAGQDERRLWATLGTRLACAVDEDCAVKTDPKNLVISSGFSQSLSSRKWRLWERDCSVCASRQCVCI